MSIFVTGGAGFVGSHLVRRLAPNHSLKVLLLPHETPLTPVIPAEFQQGVYTLSLSSLMLNAGINSVCIGFGLFSMVYSSKRVLL